MIDVKRLNLDPSRRSIVVSDIHANVNQLKNLLKKVKFSNEDYLFINGDLCEKGPDSLGTVAFVRELLKKNANVFVTKGNCDVVFRYVFNEIEGIIPYMKKQKNSILNEMLRKHGRSVEEFNDLTELAHFYRQNFEAEIQWLESLPVAYETNDFIVIHAGIENRKDWTQTAESIALYCDAFFTKKHHAGKPVIVGHWPVVNYRATEVSCHNPFIDLTKMIISIDGGNQIKADGQLNALIFENHTYTYTYVDELIDEMRVLDDYQDTTGRKGTVTYPNYDMKVIHKEDYFTLCENRKLGIQQWIKNEYLVQEGEQIICKDDLSTTFLSVKKDEIVWVVDKDCDGYILVKRLNGEIGWIPKEICKEA